ncbi:muskelin [Pieris rapae]|uniref:muskelin n=1 Tax=Pieris rapae TaxID=64459 RepID=UPI001E27B644|nr:muskelin [Pieris rapae]
MDDKFEILKLNYKIHKYSSFSAHYVPENILVNNPSDQLSRWFTDSSTSSQFIVLKLDSPAIVETIKFGKYIKPHVSDLKKFQVYGGTDESNLSLLLTGGLRKDSVAEIFRLRHKTTEGLYLPVKYIKIVPLQSWGPVSNYTIWYVELEGKKQPELISNVMETINMRKEEEAVRILLKHLRRRRYKDAFEALSRESGVQLEGHMQARLWNALVENGDYKLAERIFEESARDGELDWYMSWQPYTPEWRKLCGCSAQVEERLCCGEASPEVHPRPHDLSCVDRDPRLEGGDVALNGNEAMENCFVSCGTACSNRPGPRGGHQLVVDPNTGTLYLFGGWNGTEDLDDLWSFDTVNERWSLLCRHSGMLGGPSPRSCHKMVFDPINEKLYTIGRYLDNAQRTPANLNSDLYVYSVRSAEWSLVMSDTAANGGPRLVFDHQMCMDPDTSTIYVFGGRVLPANTEETASPQYSGLYAYYIQTCTWHQLLPDDHDLPAPQPRVSHSMLFHPIQRRLYIFAGQRNKEQLLDAWWYEAGSGRGGALCLGSCAPPAAGFTQRATVDPDTDEIFVLSGMSKEKDRRVYNTLWVLSLRRLTWSCVYRNEAVTPLEPRPRFAHQLVYDPVRKIHYLFGGNPGSASSPRLRLDDLWALRLTRPALSRVVDGARAALRESCYRELAADPAAAPEALAYLRRELSDVIDHADPEQVAKFQRLATALFAGRVRDECAPVSLSPRRVRALARRRAAVSAPADLARALAAVLGVDDTIPEATQPFEEATLPDVDTWDVGRDDEEPVPASGPGGAWDERAARIGLYERLAAYFRPSTVPPTADILDLVAL